MSTALSAQQQEPIAPPQDQTPDWKRQLAERLDAYRSKHPDAISQPSSATNTFADSRSSKIARSVASRYAAAPSYSELLAEAEKAAAAVQAAQAERIAHEQLAAHEAAVAEEQIAGPGISASQLQADSAGCGSDAGSQISPSPMQPGTPVMPQFAPRNQEMRMHQAAPGPEPSLEDLWASSLVEPRALLPSKLIEFPRELVSSRRARPRLPEGPDSEATSMAVPQDQLRIFEVQPEDEAAQANRAATLQPDESITASPSAAPPLSEIARQSPSTDAIQGPARDAAQVGARKSVPAIAGEAPRSSVNRTEPSSTVRTAIPVYRRSESSARPASGMATARAFKSLEWAAISLDKEPATRSRRQETSVAETVPFLVDPASIDRRLMAFAVDFAAVTAGFLGFLVIFVASTPHLPTGFTAVALGGAVYASLWLLYQMLFFSLSGATAGMLYARIALCTFDDRNPTRSALRRRLAAWWLSCLPLGIGFLWCFVDEDNLSWHDRMTGMYQREY